MKVGYLMLVAIWTWGCVSTHTERMTDVNPEGWARQEPATVVWNNEDTVSLRDIQLLVRYDGRAANQRLTFDMEVITPDTLSYSELLTVYLPENKRNGECVIPYRKDALLNRKGVYVFRISTAASGVKGVEAVGINVAPAE